MPAIPMIWWLISIVSEAQNETATRARFPLALLGCAFSRRRCGRAGALSAYRSLCQRAAELADLFRQLQFAALFRAEPDQSSECQTAPAGVDVSAEAARRVRDLANRRRRDHVHHRAAEHRYSDRCAHWPCAVDVDTDDTERCDR